MEKVKNHHYFSNIFHEFTNNSPTHVKLNYNVIKSSVSLINF